MWNKVERVNSNENFVLNTDKYHTTTNDLDSFISEFKAIRTKKKWDTWGRTYLEIPPRVLSEFGVLTNAPFVCYVNYVLNKAKFYGYSGEIFVGDAAWFDEYQVIDADDIIKTETYKQIKTALHNTDESMSFQDFFNTAKEKWNIVPITNHELAEYASKLNNHIK